MDLWTEFKNHERECRRMASGTKDPKTKATWNEMAERWLRAAENQTGAEKQARTLKRTRHPQRVRQHGRMNASP